MIFAQNVVQTFDFFIVWYLYSDKSYFEGQPRPDRQNEAIPGPALVTRSNHHGDGKGSSKSRSGGPRGDLMERQHVCVVPEDISWTQLGDAHMQRTVKDGPFSAVSTPNLAMTGSWKSLVEIYKVHAILYGSDLKVFSENIPF